MILRTQHILISRAVGGVAFALALVLTPRAWVEEEVVSDEVPIEALSSTPECETQAGPRMWLNPDEVPAQAECDKRLQTERPSS